MGGWYRLSGKGPQVADPQIDGVEKVGRTGTLTPLADPYLLAFIQIIKETRGSAGHPEARPFPPVMNLTNSC